MMFRRSTLKHHRVKELTAGIVLLCALTGMLVTARSTAPDTTGTTANNDHGSVTWNNTGSEWAEPADLS
ncbi:hypothetical protein ABTZ59_31290 [Streptomyces sp. NPDC094034]|uniref:hypothetical protein n=1 Tax=Streptomyces sp. NPDC094034 TaxID=3155309 RepID=UPI003327FA2F